MLRADQAVFSARQSEDEREVLVAERAAKLARDAFMDALAACERGARAW